MTKDDLESVNGGDAKRVDDWLRRGLGSESGTVERLVRRSLRAERPAHDRRRFLAVVTVTVTVALAAATLIFYPRLREPGPGTPTTPQEARVEILTITNESGSVELLYPSASARDSGGGPAAPPRRPREITIFNSDGIVAAIVPTPITHHFIHGGES